MLKMPIVWPGHFDAHKNISVTPSADDMTPMRNHNAKLYARGRRHW